MNQLSHLDELEAEAIYIMREVAANCEKPVMLYSIGKDSSVMLHLALKAFYPEKPPFPFSPKVFFVKPPPFCPPPADFPFWFPPGFPAASVFCFDAPEPDAVFSPGAFLPPSAAPDRPADPEFPALCAVIPAPASPLPSPNVPLNPPFAGPSSHGALSAVPSR